MSDLTIRNQKWEHQVIETVKGASWYCEVCGAAGFDHYSQGEAINEGMRHMKDIHAFVKVDLLVTEDECAT
jgi:hypothetical protein